LQFACAVGSAMAAYTPGKFQLNVDNSTYANADEIHTTHYNVDWLVNFEDETLTGTITHDLEVLQDTDRVIFDSWLINIQAIDLLAGNSGKRMRDAGVEQLEIVGSALTWDLDEYNPLIGDALTVYGNFVAG